MKVPFNRPVVLESHSEIMAGVVGSGQLAGVGPRTREVEAALAKLGLAHVLLTSSGTHALEMSALLAGFEPGDEVILPSFTFVSTANAFALRGAVLRFADNDETGNITLSEIERLATSKTKAVCVVHYAGHSSDMHAVRDWCAQRKITLVEDAAQALASKCRGQALGSFGQYAAFSFHDTKNVTSGEGGALAVSDDASRARAEIIREKGTNRAQFFQGLADKYTWVDIGSSYVLSELNVAYLQPQIPRLAEINARRGAICARYERELRDVCASRDVVFLPKPAFCEGNHHLFAMVFPQATQRTAFIAAMRDQGITTPFHYVSLHTSPYGVAHHRQHGLKVEELAGCERLSTRLVRLPLFYNMTDDEQAYVLEHAHQILKKI